MFKIFRNKIFFSILSIIMIVGTSCTFSHDPSKDPKRSLTDYVSLSFSIKNIEDKTRLMAFLTGEVKARLSGWSDEQFREAFIDSKREFLKLYFKEVKEISPTEVQITYELTYLDKGRGKDGKNHEAKITNKKLCQLIQQQGKWYISDVKNLKELVEYKDELALP